MAKSESTILHVLHRHYSAHSKLQVVVLDTRIDSQAGVLSSLPNSFVVAFVSFKSSHPGLEEYLFNRQISITTDAHTAATAQKVLDTFSAYLECEVRERFDINLLSCGGLPEKTVDTDLSI